MGRKRRNCGVAADGRRSGRGPMLCALLDGRAHTARNCLCRPGHRRHGERPFGLNCWRCGWVSVLAQGPPGPNLEPTASASTEVARMIEAISAVAADGPARATCPLSREARVRCVRLRTCYGPSGQVGDSLSVRYRREPRMVADSLFLPVSMERSNA